MENGRLHSTLAWAWGGGGRMEPLCFLASSLNLKGVEDLNETYILAGLQLPFSPEAQITRLTLQAPVVFDLQQFV